MKLDGDERNSSRVVECETRNEVERGHPVVYIKFV